MIDKSMWLKQSRLEKTLYSLVDEEHQRLSPICILFLGRVGRNSECCIKCDEQRDSQESLIWYPTIMGLDGDGRKLELVDSFRVSACFDCMSFAKDLLKNRAEEIAAILGLEAHEETL